MMRGLEGRRIALIDVGGESGQNSVRSVISALEESGVKIESLTPGQGNDEDWHGARYAALVLVGGEKGEAGMDARLVQLAREFLASEKPVAAFGDGLRVILKAGGAAGRTLAASTPLEPAVHGAGGKSAAEPIAVDGALITGQNDPEAFAARVVRELSRQLEEGEVDDMLAQSFPASDPPATTPSIGPKSPDRETDSRP